MNADVITFSLAVSLSPTFSLETRPTVLWLLDIVVTNADTLAITTSKSFELRF